MRLGHRLLTGGCLRGMALVVSAMGSLYTMPIMIHSLGNRWYSLWILAGTLVTYCGLTDIGLSQAVSQFFASAYGVRDKKRMNEVFTTGMVLYSIISFVIIVLSLLIAWISIQWIDSVEEKRTFFYIVVLFGMTFASQFHTRVAGGVLYSLVRHDLIVIGSIVENIVRVSLIVYTLTHGYGLIVLATITFSTNFLENLWQFNCVRVLCPELRIRKQYLTRDCYRSLFGYSTIAFVSNISNLFKLQLLPLLVTRLVSLEALALFSVAQRFLSYCSQLAKTVSDMLASVFSQLHSRGEKDKMYDALSITTSLGTICAGYIGLVIVLYGKSFIIAWLGESFIESSTLMYILAIPVCIEIITTPSKELLYGAARHKGLAYLHLIEFVSAILLAYVFGYYFGLIGIVIGFSIGIVPFEVIGIPLLISRFFKSHFFDQPIQVGYVILKWGMASVILFKIIHPYVKPNFYSLLEWNFIQLIISIPALYMSLPRDVRYKIYALLMINHSKEICVGE